MSVQEPTLTDQSLFRTVLSSQIFRAGRQRSMFHAKTIWVLTASLEFVFIVVMVLDLLIIHVEARGRASDFDVTDQGDRAGRRCETGSGYICSVFTS